MANYKLGSKGKQVVEIQNALIKSGVSPKVKASGDFGKDTHKAVRAYQKKNGLKVDGIVGPKTSGKMFGKGGDAKKIKLSRPDPHADAEKVRKELSKIHQRMNEKLVTYISKGGDTKGRFFKDLRPILDKCGGLSLKHTDEIDELFMLQMKFYDYVEDGDVKNAQAFKKKIEGSVKTLSGFEKACRKTELEFKKAFVSGLKQMFGMAA